MKICRGNQNLVKNRRKISGTLLVTTYALPIEIISIKFVIGDFMKICRGNQNLFKNRRKISDFLLQTT